MTHKDVQLDDYHGTQAFRHYATTKVRNRAQFYKHLRKTGQKNKCIIARTAWKRKHI